MESMNPSPAKRMRTSDGMDLQVTECIREFMLPQQFPSMVTSQKDSAAALKARNLTNLSSPSGLPKNIKLVANKDKQVLNKLQKLKIKSPDGKDLGEIRVKLVSQKNDSVRYMMSKTVVFNSQPVFKPLNKPVTLSVVPSADKTKKALGGAHVGQATGIKVTKTIASNHSVKSVDQGGSGNSDRSSLVKSKSNAVITKPASVVIKEENPVPQSNQKSNKALSSNKNDGASNKTFFIKVKNQKELKGDVAPVNKVEKYLKLALNKKLVIINDLPATQLVKYKNDTTGNVCGSNGRSLIASTSNSSESTSHKSAAPIKYVQCKKSEIKSAQSSASTTANNAGKISVATHLKTVDDIQESDEPQIVGIKINERKSDQIALRHNEKSGASNNDACVALKNVTSDKKDAVTPQSNQQSKTKLGENVMVVVHNNKSALLTADNPKEQQDNVTSPNSSSTVDKMNVNTTTGNQILANALSNDCEELEPQTQFWNKPEATAGSNSTNSNARNKENVVPNDNITNVSLKDKIQDHWTIIEKAVNSVKDEELRAKALKALADCGIGRERHVPICPKDLKAVHDSQVQTTVFGLLDTENFVLINEEMPDVRRIRQNEGVFTNAAPTDMYVDTQNNGALNNFPNSENPIFLTAESLAEESNDIFEFRKFFNEHCSQNPTAGKVKKVLSQPNLIRNQIYAQLQRDYETIKTYDENGMLNIHKAVMNDSIHDVQRFLMVLKACKESIDTPTQCGMTSLELAIEHNVSAQIVQVLLQAGAQPVLSQPAHDSALTIASKRSSQYLHELTSHIKDQKLLDQVDSTGFAAVHYCALNGDLKGVTSLVSAGAMINLKDSRSGRTAFFHALENNHIAVAQYLLDNGAIANSPNFAGQTVLSLVDDVKSLSLRTSLNRAIK